MNIFSLSNIFLRKSAQGFEYNEYEAEPDDEDYEHISFMRANEPDYIRHERSNLHKQLADFNETDKEKESNRDKEKFEKFIQTAKQNRYDVILSNNPLLTKEDLDNMSNDELISLYQKAQRKEHKKLMDYLKEKNIDVGKYTGVT